MVIGSQALKHHFPNYPRSPKDFDVVVYDEYNKKDLQRIHRGSSEKFEFLINPVLVDFFNKKLPNVCPLNELYTLKISHSFWSLNNKSWEKHMWDIQYMREKGAIFIPELFYKLFDYWNSLHGVRLDSFEKTKNLGKNLTSKDFFSNSIKNEISHDDLHEILISHSYFKNVNIPTYKLILKDNSEVDVCMNKFKLLTDLQKFNVVFEEVAVMAYERYKQLFYKAAFEVMLKKFVLYHCKIEEGIWIIQNHKYLLQNIPFNFIEFLNKNNNGKN